MKLPTLLLGVFLLNCFLLAQCDYWTDLSPDPCIGPRIRRSWADLSSTEQRNFVSLVYKLKSTNLLFYNIPRVTVTYPAYNFFVDVHNNGYNSALWHGTSIFTLVHRHFIYNLEGAVRYIARVYGPSMDPPITDPCIGLPYWPWEFEVDTDLTDDYSPQNHSVMFSDPDLFGPPPGVDPTFEVATGQFGRDKWKTVTELSLNPKIPMGPTQPGYNYTLKRYFTSAVPFVYGPSTIMNKIIQSPAFSDYMPFLENGPHSNPHVWLSFYMSTMASPDDPLFFLHHSNIDRWLTMWQDCWDYEFVNPEELNSTHYSAVNPEPPSKSPKMNARTGAPYDVDIDTPMQYYWKGSSDSKVFPSTKWPTPRDMWSIGFEGSPGYDGMYYRYGPDRVVELYGSACPSRVWSWLDYGTSKRNVEDSVETHIDGLMAKLLSLKLQNSGKDHNQTLQELALWECLNTPQLNLTSEFDGWLEMNGLSPEHFDRVCDNSSQKYYQRKKSEEAQRLAYIQMQEKTANDFLYVTIAVGGLIVLIIIVITVVFVVKKISQKRAASSGGEYVTFQ